MLDGCKAVAAHYFLGIPCHCHNEVLKPKDLIKGVSYPSCTTLIGGIICTCIHMYIEEGFLFTFKTPKAIPLSTVRRILFVERNTRGVPMYEEHGICLHYYTAYVCM